MATNSLMLLPLRGAVYVPFLEARWLCDCFGQQNMAEVTQCQFPGSGLMRLVLPLPIS